MNTLEEIKAPFAPGTQIRVTEDHEVDGSWVRKGQELTVEDFNPAGDPAEDYLPYDWYWTEDAYGSNREVRADKVERVRTAEQMRARRLPTTAEMIAALHCLGDYDGFRIDEADAPFDTPSSASREIAGRTDDGLFFSATITVSNVYHADF